MNVKLFNMAAPTKDGVKEELEEIIAYWYAKASGGFCVELKAK